jgi:hypothetical protein
MLGVVGYSSQRNKTKEMEKSQEKILVRIVILRKWSLSISAHLLWA